jgi:hypothetical protein
VAVTSDKQTGFLERFVSFLYKYYVVHIHYLGCVQNIQHFKNWICFYHQGEYLTQLGQLEGASLEHWADNGESCKQHTHYHIHGVYVWDLTIDLAFG